MNRGSVWLHAAELGQRDLVPSLFEHHLDRHADGDFVHRTIDDVAVQAQPLLELDDDDAVWHEVDEGGVNGLVTDGVGIDNASAAKWHPFEVRRTALSAARPWRMPEDATAAAALGPQLTLGTV